MQAHAHQLLAALSAMPAQGPRFVVALAHGTMSVEMYAPIGTDPQSPHDQDELYFIHAGTGVFMRGDERLDFAAGDCLFVAAGVVHRFEAFSEDFAAWVVFWGPRGGE